MEYQLFEYSEGTGLVTMLDRVTYTTATISGLEPDITHSYIVQPISYTEICDNVYPEYSVQVVCSDSFVRGDVNADGQFNVSDLVMLQKWLLASTDAELKNWKAGDLCEDNRIDVFDMILMRNYIIS